MDINVKLTWKHLIVAIIIFGAGSAVSYTVNQPNEKVICGFPKEIGLSEGDFNALVAVEIMGGFCERIGLLPTVLVQEDEEGNQYGVPICVGGEMNG